MNHNAGHPHVTIRPLAAQDRAEWDVLWSEYLAFYETTLPSSIYDLTFSRLTDDAHANMYGFVALVGGKAAGLVHCIMHDHCWKTEQVCYLQDLYTTPDFRGQGVAEALIHHVYYTADGRNAASTYWLTQEFNHKARALYDRVAELTPFIKYQRA